MNELLEKTESLANNFEEMSKNYCFIKEKITNFYYISKFKINFKHCFVAISKNGGLLAICKKKGYFDVQKNSLFNNNIVIMQQNAKHLFTIPITWNYQKRWLVAFDFSQNEKLYGICNDGTIYKFDILLKQAKEQLTSQILTQEQIYTAKFIEKGFIVLTCFGTFYYVKEFKNINPISIFQINSILEFSNNVDFIAIPPQASKSGKLELIFTNEKGNGVVHVMEQPKGHSYNILPIEIDNKTEITIDGVSELDEEELKPYIKRDNDINSSDNINKNNSENTINTNATENEKKITKKNPKSMGKIISMAISPSYSQIAFYNNEGKVFIFNTKFDKGRKETNFGINGEFTDKEINEIKNIIKYNENCDFLFCGEDAVALYGDTFVLIVNSLKKTLIFKIMEKESNIPDTIYAKCISEVDGLRICTNDGIFFISKVDLNLYKVCYPFENNSAKKLLIAYDSDRMDDPESVKKIKDISKDLSKSIFVLINAAANIFWTENEPEDNKKEVQMYLLKAAQLGKIYVDTEEGFNYDKFIEKCKDIRIINDIRNNKETPIFITYKEYGSIDTKDLIKKIIYQQNFNLAFRISKYLGLDTKKIYQKWACCKIKKLKSYSTKKEQMKLYDDILLDLNDIKNISFIQLAKKAFKYKQSELGMKFLEKEKSILAKIPIYLKHNKWEKVLELSYETYDSDIMYSALNQLIDYNGVDNEFIEKVKDLKYIKYPVIDFLKKNGKEFIRKYLEDQEEYEELMMVELEHFFTSNTLDDKRKHLKLAKEYQKKLDKNHINNKFYTTYLTELGNSIKFKRGCMESDRNIIPKSYIQPFDNSIYDCYKLGVKNNKFDWIEGQNKNYDLNDKKMTIMRFRTMAENNKIELIEEIIKTSSLKRLGITAINMADLYFDFKQYDLVVKYLKLITHPDYFEYKIEMLKYMEKYEDAIEVAISSKNMDKIPYVVNDILKRKPDLQKLVEDLCVKYKVNLS